LYARLTWTGMGTLYRPGRPSRGWRRISGLADNQLVEVEDGRLRGEFPVRRAAAGPVDDRPLRAVPAERRRRAAGPGAPRSASSSTARWRLTDSTSSPRRSEALVSPSVTYGPNLPSLITMGRLEAGSSPSSRSGGAAARRPRVLGWSKSSLASASVSVNSCSSLSRERLSLPFFT